MYCYLFAEYVVPAPVTTPPWKWETKKEGFDQFMLVFPTNLYFVPTGKAGEVVPTGKYIQSQFTGTDIAYNPAVGSRIVVCGSESGENTPNPPIERTPKPSVANPDSPTDEETKALEKWEEVEAMWIRWEAIVASVDNNNLFIASSVAGVVAGGYRNFTTHLRQIMTATEDRQDNNPELNPEQSKYIGSVRLAGNSFIEGSMTRGADFIERNGDISTTDRKFIDRQVLEDRLRSRIQEECLRVMTHGNGVPFTESGASLIAGAGEIALSEAAGLNIIDDFETEVNYGDVTRDDIEKRHYKTLVYRFRFAGSIEFVQVTLEV
jgi:hypothetical protein